MEASSGLKELQQFIAERYAIGEVGLPRPLAHVHQRRHRKLVLDATAGRFLVKTYRRDPAVLDALRFQHRLAGRLESIGLPVARIEAAQDGRRLAEGDTWAIELQEFVEGEPMPVNKSALTQAGQALGRLHEGCRDFPCPERDPTEWRLSDTPTKSFATFYETARAGGDPEACADQCNRIVRFLRDAEHALRWEVRNELEIGLIHGDWHGGNLIYRDGKLAAIVDLEFAGEGCFLEDLAYALSNLCIRTCTDPARLVWRTDAFLRAYQQHRTLAFTEETVLYYAAGLKHVATLCFQFQQFGGSVGGYTTAEWLERLALQCDWLTDRVQRSVWR
ncbi:MAG: phosphotransferase [Candidatus Hydrogenedentota bacterium]